jgi:hypothetical protein
MSKALYIAELERQETAHAAGPLPLAALKELVELINSSEDLECPDMDAHEFYHWRDCTITRAKTVLKMARGRHE